MDGEAMRIEAAAHRSARTLDVSPGNALVREGCEGDEAFVLVWGRAEVIAGGRRVGEIQPGELFGEIAPLVRGPRLATVVATESSRVTVLDSDTTQKLLRQPEVAAAVTARLTGWLRQAQSPNGGARSLSRLTAAEQRVAALVAEGLTNRQIGAHLLVSPHTVDAHLRHIYSKLGIISRVELATCAVRAGVG